MGNFRRFTNQIVRHLNASFLVSALILCGFFAGSKDSIGWSLKPGDTINEKNMVSTAVPLVFNNKTLDFCTGALIYPRVVLTAAHCLIGSHTDYTVVVGANPYKKSIARRKVIRFLSRMEQQAMTDQNRNLDIALLILDRPIRQEQPIYLPKSEWAIWDQVPFTSFGYGRLEENPKLTRGDFQFQESLATPVLTAQDTADHALIPGDSGGPALIYFDKKLYVVGVLSGKNAATKLNYFANVLSSKAWIEDQLKTLK